MSELKSQELIQKTEKAKREIIFAWNYVEWGGVQIYFLGIMRLAVSKGFLSSVAMPANSSPVLLDYLRAENVSVTFFNAQIYLQQPKNIWDRIRRRFSLIYSQWVLGAHLRRQNLPGKIVQIDVAVWLGFWLLLYLAMRTHVFLTMHIATPYNPKSPRHWIIKLKYQVLCLFPTFHLLASNNDMKLSLRPVVPEKKWRQIPIAYTGVNTNEIKKTVAAAFKRDEMIAKHDLPPAKVFAFALANIIERKGFRVFLKTAKECQEKNKNLFFVWIGDGENYQEMLDLIDEFSLTEAVKIIRPSEFGGERPDLLQLLRLADIFVHPSFAEGLPGALLEAMALGKPVVASRVNAIPECVIEGENGFLVEAGDVDGFSFAIEKLANDTDLRQNLGANAQRQILTNFTEEQCAEITIDFYERCLFG